MPEETKLGKMLVSSGIMVNKLVHLDTDSETTVTNLLWSPMVAMYSHICGYISFNVI